MKKLIAIALLSSMFVGNAAVFAQETSEHVGQIVRQMSAEEILQKITEVRAQISDLRQKIALLEGERREGEVFYNISDYTRDISSFVAVVTTLGAAGKWMGGEKLSRRHIAFLASSYTITGLAALAANQSKTKMEISEAQKLSLEEELTSLDDRLARYEAAYKAAEELN